MAAIAHRGLQQQPVCQLGGTRNREVPATDRDSSNSRDEQIGVVSSSKDANKSRVVESSKHYNSERTIY
jgi:hypothetical protein